MSSSTRYPTTEILEASTNDQHSNEPHWKIPFQLTQTMTDQRRILTNLPFADGVTGQRSDGCL